MIKASNTAIQLSNEQESAAFSQGGLGFFRSSVVVTLFSALNLVVGFFSQVVLASKFGAEMEMDAYWAAVSIPTLLSTVLLGSLNIAFVPVLISYETKPNQSKDGVWKTASSFFNLLVIILTLLALLGSLGAPLLVRLANPGFAPESEVFALTVHLMRILFPSIVFSGLGGLLSSLHYAHHRFVAPSLLPVLNSAAILGSTLLLASRLGVASVAVGTSIGGVVQFLVVLPILLKGKRYRLILDIKDESVGRIVRLMAPWILGAIVSKANPLIDRFVASNLQAGSISYLGYAYKLLQISTMLVSRGIAIVLFPVLAQKVTGQDWQGLKQTALWGMGLISLLVWPMIIGIVFLREPVIQLLYERGRFTHLATLATGRAWLAYLGAFWATSVGSVLAYVFYAMQDTRTVMKVGIIGAILNAVLALMLSKRIGYIGPAFGFSIVSIVNFGVMAYILLKRLKGATPLQHREGGKVAFATLITTAGLWGAKLLLDIIWRPASKVQLAIYLLSLGIFTLVIYGVSLFALKVDQVCFLRRAVLRELRGRR